MWKEAVESFREENTDYKGEATKLEKEILTAEEIRFGVRLV